MVLDILGIEMGGLQHFASQHHREVKKVLLSFKCLQSRIGLD